MDLVQKGALNVLKNGFRLKEGETFVIVCDHSNSFFSDALSEAAIKLGAKPTVFMLEDFGKRPFKCPEKIMEAVRRADAGTLCATERLGEVELLRPPLYNCGRGHPVRFATMTGISKKAIEVGLNCDFKKLALFTEKIFGLVKDSKEVRIVTDKGTDLTITVGKYKWVCCNGKLKPDVKDDNFPDGEVFTAPEDVNGKIVVDGDLGDIYDAKYGIITKTPLTICIKDCYAQKEGFHCDNKGLEKDIFAYLFTGHKYSSRVGETAFGTNLQIKKIIGNLLLDEKFPSFHIAFGDCYPNDTGCPYSCPKHIDMVILKPDIYVDGRQIMKKGKYLIKP